MNKNIKFRNGRFYWIQKNGEETPELAMYHTVTNGMGFFFQMHMKSEMTCSSVDVDFMVLKEANFEDGMPVF